ncbi:hypothetical protein [Corynebacterium bovis]|uniref:Uncharacterized protein n=1 Tax=Corynebacterium bovis TaxID=36808 RepID=A0A426PXH1_9CORY|nr:hypothetical protein [Corynebacterium bovis]MDN8579003.1 hypothetical protein [Corynebacterium bovis]RRO85918.1 hypothetical protein CXF48_08805 [Corynebacterium bovis]RRO89807.1 hypothetical protein CXF30_02285 [Corynebacterium bovis]
MIRYLKKYSGYAVVPAGLFGTFGALPGSTLYTILGGKGYPLGVFPGYVVVYIVCLGLFATDNWRKPLGGTWAADILDLAVVVLPMGTMILCTAFIPWSAFHSLPAGGASFVTAVGMWVLYEVVTRVVPVVADRIEGIPREEREEREERPPRPMIGLLIGALLLGGWYLSATGQQWGLALIAAGLVIAVAWQVRRQRTSDQAPDDEAPSDPDEAPDDEAPDDQVPSDEAPDDQEPSALPSGSDDHHAPGTPGLPHNGR